MMNRKILKILLIYLPLTLVGSTCFAQFTNSNEPRDGRLNGKVDSVVSTYFNIKIGGVKELNDRCTDLYNDKGLLIEERLSDFDSTETRSFKTTYSYDEKDNYKQGLDYSLSGKLKGRDFYTFDPLKRLVEIRNIRYLTTTLLLDKAGNVLENINYQLQYPTPFSTTLYKYNSKGLCIESFQTWTGSTDSHQILYTYNADNSLTKEIVHNDGSLLASYTYSYPKLDKKHNWLIQNKYRDGHLINVAERIIAYRK
jgi:hypothetical protein